MKLDNYPFDGWDFMELAEAWNIHVPYDSMGVITDADGIVMYLESVMKSYDGNESTRCMKKCAKDIRIFCIGLSKGWGYDGPLYKGLSEITDDWTIISYAMKLMGNMWY